MKKILLNIFIFLVFSMPLMAADEFVVYYDADCNLYGVIKEPNGYVWSTSLNDFEAWYDANIADYNIPLTDVNDETYTGDFNSLIPAGDYILKAYYQANASPNAVNDICVAGPDDFAWDGSAEITDYTRDVKLNSISADVNHSNNVWYVSKDGSDSYDGHSLQSSFLTIGQAVSSCASGDKIIVYPGTYVEAVDFDTADKSNCTLEGISRTGCIVAPTGSGDKAVTCENYTTLRNMTFSSTNGTAMGVYTASGKTGIIIDNCSITGALDGLYMDDSSGGTIRITDSDIFCKYDAFYAGLGVIVQASNTSFRTDGSYNGTISCRCAAISGPAIFDNCVFEINRTISSTGHMVGIKPTSRVVATGCLFELTGGSNCSGEVRGIHTTSSFDYITVNACTFKTINAGSGGATDLVHEAGIIIVSDSLYSTTSGTITDTLDDVSNKVIDLWTDGGGGSFGGP